MDPRPVNGVVSIPLSGRVLQREAGAADDGRPLPSLCEFVAGPENQLLVAAIRGCLANLEVGGEANGGALGGVRETAHRSLAAASGRPGETFPAADSAWIECGVACEEPPVIDARQSLLILHGPPGTGKSHLAFGLYQQWRRHRPHEPALYLAAVDFARGIHEALDARTIDAFREHLRSAGLLVIEDLGHLASRTTAQIELMSLLDDVADPCQPSAQVVLTSRLAPEQMASLAPGLAARLSSGVSVSMALPSAATRRELLSRLAQQRRTPISAQALGLLAESVAGPAPELFGALLHLETAAIVEGHRIDVPQVHQYVARRSGPRTPSLRGIAVQTARFFSLEITDLKSPSRRRAVVLARGVAMYLARQLTGKSLEEIGHFFGGRDHTTVLHGCRKMEQVLKTDPDARLAVRQLHQTLAGV